MATAAGKQLRDFGVRSLLTHVIMAAGLGAAVVSGLLLGESQVGLVSFVAFLNFTAGMWICQSIHALGNPEYTGVLNVLRDNVR